MSLDTKRFRRPFFYDWVVDNHMIYFSMCNYNALCRANLDNSQVEIIATLPDIPCEKGNEYFGIYQYKNYLLLGPLKSTSDFLVYDILNSRFIKILSEGEKSFYSSRVFEKGGFLYVVSAKTAEVNKIDLQNLSIKRIMCKQFFPDNAQINEIAKVDDLLYIPLNQEKKLLIFSMENENYRYCEFPINVSFISTIEFYGDKFWITGESKKLYVWNIGETKAQERANFPDDIKLFYPRNIWFGNSYIYNDCLWLFPAYADSILKYNIITNKMEKYEILGEEESAEQMEVEWENGRRFAAKYGIVKKHGSKVFFLSSKTKLFYQLDLLENHIDKYDFKMINIYNNQIYPPGIMTEINFGVDGLIRSVMRSSISVGIKKEKMIGENIYNFTNVQNQY